MKDKKMYISNKLDINQLNEIYVKNKKKENMYNYIFNDKMTSIPYSNELKFILGEKENERLDNIIDKINTEIKSNSIKKIYQNYSHSKTKVNNYEEKKKNHKRNNSYKNSYSKYYLNRLELENKYLIPQLNNNKLLLL